MNYSLDIREPSGISWTPQRNLSQNTILSIFMSKGLARHCRVIISILVFQVGRLFMFPPGIWWWEFRGGLSKTILPYQNDKLLVRGGGSFRFEKCGFAGGPLVVRSIQKKGKREFPCLKKCGVSSFFKTNGFINYKYIYIYYNISRFV